MKKILTIFGTSLIAQIITLVYGLVLPREILAKYGSEVNGLIQSITQFLGLISFLELGIGQVVQSALYKPLADRDYRKISCILASGKKFYRRIALALVLYVGMLICVYPVVAHYSFSRFYIITLIAILSISMFAQYYFGIVYEQLLHADQRSYLIYIMQVITNVVSLLVCVWMIRCNATIHTLKLVTSGIFLAKPLVYRMYIRRNYCIISNVTYAEEPIKQKWNGTAQHFSSVVLSGTDNIVLTLFSTLQNVSVYSVYYMVVSSIQRFYYTATVGIQAAAGRVWAKRDHDDIKRFFSIIESSLHGITVFLFCCTAILIIPFVQIYTNGLTDINYIHPDFAYLLIFAYGIFCLRTPYNIWILAAGHFKQTQRCHITAATMNLLISIFAVSRWGLVGIAIGTLIAMCYQTIWMMIYTTNKLIKCSAFHLLKQWIADIAAVLLICVATSGIVLQEVSYLRWFLMAVKVAVIAAVCTAAVFCAFYPKQIGRLIKKCSAKTSNQK